MSQYLTRTQHEFSKLASRYYTKMTIMKWLYSLIFMTFFDIIFVFLFEGDMA